MLRMMGGLIRIKIASQKWKSFQESEAYLCLRQIVAREQPQLLHIRHLDRSRQVLVTVEQNLRFRSYSCYKKAHRRKKTNRFHIVHVCKPRKRLYSIPANVRTIRIKHLQKRCSIDRGIVVTIMVNYSTLSSSTKSSCLTSFSSTSSCLPSAKSPKKRLRK